MAHPLADRYASNQMKDNFSNTKKYTRWRGFWIDLAESQKDLGLDYITDLQIEEMRANQNITEEAIKKAKEDEKTTKHDVISHIAVYGKECPTAKPIIHHGATSMYVTDNTDLVEMKNGLEIVRDKAVCCINRCGQKIEQIRKDYGGNIPCVGYTHLQRAEPVTVDKRIAGWGYDMFLALEDIEYRLENLKLLGSKGTTGTQASFMKIFRGDQSKVIALDKKIAEKAGFKGTYLLTGQTYPRIVDHQILSSLVGAAVAAKKTGNDIRHLQMIGEAEEPFEEGQKGSSAMAFKRNPNRSERMCGLARYLIGQAGVMASTAGEQILERVLDDSSTRRITIPDAFYAADAILNLYNFVTGGLVIYPEVIKMNLETAMPFLATEDIIMAAVEKGADSQVCKKRIRDYSMDVVKAIREKGLENDLLQRLATDEYISQFLKESEIKEIGLSPNIGTTPMQVDEFFGEIVEPLREKYPHALDIDSGIKI